MRNAPPRLQRADLPSAKSCRAFSILLEVIMSRKLLLTTRTVGASQTRAMPKDSTKSSEGKQFDEFTDRTDRKRRPIDSSISPWIKGFKHSQTCVFIAEQYRAHQNLYLLPTTTTTTTTNITAATTTYYLLVLHTTCHILPTNCDSLALLLLLLLLLSLLITTTTISRFTPLAGVTCKS